MGELDRGGVYPVEWGIYPIISEREITMDCGREAMFVVDTEEPASYWACERHVGRVAAYRKAIRVEDSCSLNHSCCWELVTGGEGIRIILDRIGWTQKMLSDISGVPQQSVSELIRGKKRLVPVTAIKLGAALGLEPLAMLNTQADYDLRKSEIEHPGLADEVKARLHSEQS